MHGAQRHEIGDVTAYEGSRLNGEIRHPTVVLTIAHSIRTLEEFIRLQGR